MYEDKTVEEFSKSVIKQANLERETILEEGEKEYREATEKKREDTKGYDRRIKSELERLQLVKKNAITNANDEGRRMIAEKRQELTEDLFNEVHKEILKFIKSKEYLPWLTEQIEAVKKNCECDDAVIFLNTEDKLYEEDIRKANKCSIQFVDEEHLGGCRIMLNNNKRLIDATLKVKFEEAKNTFYGFNMLEVK